MLVNIISFVIFKLILVSASDVVPVLIWEEGKETTSNNLRWSENKNRLSSTEFGDTISKYLAEEKKILIFLQDQVAIEDFSSYSDDTSPFKFLKQKIDTRPKIYFPYVSDPVRGLSQLEKYFTVYHELADNQQEVIKHMAEPGSVMVYVHLPKTTQQYRRNTLEKNDKMMGELVKVALWTADEFVIIFTGEASTVVDEEEIHSSRRLLATDDQEIAPTDTAPSDKAPADTAPADNTPTDTRVVPEAASVNFKSNCSMIFVKNVSLLVQNGTKDSLGLADVSSRCVNGSQTSVTMKWTGTSEGDVDLEIKFVGGSKKDWKITSMQLNATGKSGMGSVNNYRTKDLFAPRGFSYKCGGPNYFKPTGNASLKLRLDDFMVQPLFGVGVDEFGRPYDCVGFFTAPILAGVMITLMFAMILYWALSMVMGIQTMDQFDDPKGPSISVPQSD